MCDHLRRNQGRVRLARERRAAVPGQAFVGGIGAADAPARVDRDHGIRVPLEERRELEHFDFSGARSFEPVSNLPSGREDADDDVVDDGGR